MHRILFLTATLLLLAACGSLGVGGHRDLNKPAPAGDQRIVLWNKPSGERIDVVFRRDGHYDLQAFDKVDHIFRDRHSGEEYAIDPDLIELIAGLRDRMVMAPDTPIELLSGYRSPESNAMLSRTNKYVARQSYHMQGKAADIRIAGMNSRALELVAKTIQKGGVALYPDSSHVHVDTGPVRGWEVVHGYEEGLDRADLKAIEAARPAAAPVTLSPVRKLLPKVTVTPPASPASAAKNVRVRTFRAHPVYTAPRHKGPSKKPTPHKKLRKSVKKPLPKTPVPDQTPAAAPPPPTPESAPAPPSQTEP